MPRNVTGTDLLQSFTGEDSGIGLVLFHVGVEVVAQAVTEHEVVGKARGIALRLVNTLLGDVVKQLERAAGLLKLGGEVLWEIYTYPSLNSTIILGLIFIQSHDGKIHHGLYINICLSEIHFKINIIVIKF